MQKNLLALSLALLAVGCEPPPTETDSTEAAITLPASFSDNLVASVASPTDLAFLPDGKLLVTTQPGRLRLIVNGALQATPALDLSAKLCSNSERGLLGVAVDPSFASNHRIYVYYTFNKNNSCATNSTSGPVNRVSRFTLADSGIADPASELVLVDNMPSVAGNHNAGDLHFGSDGNLYISVGDGGCKIGDSSRCAGQNDNARRLDILSGKILRVTPAGAIPGDNPKASDPAGRRCGNPAGVPGGTGPCVEMYAWGFRNPFRFATRGNEIWVNDVGQDQWEEVDILQKGADYGWNAREGHCANGSTTNCGAPPSGMTNPLFDYKHGSNASGSPFQGCNSITGGAFVPASWPAPYGGQYLFSDYVCGQIFVLTRSGASASAASFAGGLGGSSAVSLVFGPSATGQSLYYTTYAGGGQVRRIDYTGSQNRAPTAVINASPTSGAAPLAVSFDGSGSSDPDAGDTLTYLWDFGDGATTTTTTATTSHSYTSGTFTASLRVRDSHAATSAAVTQRIDAGNTPPVPAISSPSTSLRFAVGQTITLSGGASDAQDGAEPASRLSWTVLLHHNEHTHPYFGPTSGNNLTITAPPPEDLEAVPHSYLEIYLTATDANGLSATVMQQALPHIVQVGMATDPTGLVLGVNGTTVTAPATLPSWQGYALNVSAASQSAGGKSYKLASWSDGGAAAHTITTPASDATYTATFAPGFGASVNFQTADAPVPAGYVADTGAPFGARAGGLSYGWNADNAAQARWRNAASSPDGRYDTLIHLQKPANPDASWEIAVPNGSYHVHIVAGDAGYTDSVLVLAAEGTTVVNGTPTNAAHWVTGDANVTVSDGRLTVRNGAGAQNNKICFIDITQN